MKYKFFTNSVEAWDAMRTSIAGAKKYIYLETYILEDDAEARRFLDILREKSREGVVVKIVADSFGSFELSSMAEADLKKDGVELMYFNRLLPWWNINRFRRWWFLRTHRKILVVDGSVGFIGGVNIGERFKHWEDLHLMVEDGAIVRSFAKSFLKSYKISGGKDVLIIPRKAPSNMNILLLDHWPIKRATHLKRFYKQACKRAEKSIVIATPYFAPHLWLLRALKKAVKRGVAVHVILPRETDVGLLNIANRVFVDLGHHLGIKFYLLPQMIHAKALLVDEREGLVGSNNIDAQSFDYNAEASVAFEDSGMVGDLKLILDNWKSRSVFYSSGDTEKKWYHFLIVWAVKLIQPIL